ncbi:hypothetical protein [Fluviicoccus keumensis]|uniref:hypothetical protein n=1 Tax=Fluviicoccus keumensis TaxID=1435465 RepID=UPI001F5FC6C6|nr:hypothetical protein [Fluviicoccus keumensis]
MLPCMCGSATLAIVVSSACMMVASITDSATRPRRGAVAGLAIEDVMTEAPDYRPGKCR